MTVTATHSLDGTKTRLTKAYLLNENQRLQATLDVYKKQHADHDAAARRYEKHIERLENDLKWIRALCQQLTQIAQARA